MTDFYDFLLRHNGRTDHVTKLVKVSQFNKTQSPEPNPNQMNKLEKSKFTRNNQIHVLYTYGIDR